HVGLCRADSMDDLRLRWRQMITGGDNPNVALPQIRSRISSVESAGRSNWTSLQKAPNRTGLWTDLPSTTIPAQVSSAYGRVKHMAFAWATPGQPLYQDGALLADLRSALNWMDANRYNSNSREYDNWWDWEIGTPALLVDVAILLYDQLTPDELTRYMAAIEK